MKYASKEIRTKVVRAYLAGKATSKQLADILGYTPATICNWVRAYRLHNRLEAMPNGHRKSCFTQKELAELSELIKKRVDITLEEIKQHFKKTCSLSAIHRIVVKLGFVYKKTLKASEHGRKDIKKAREKWQNFQQTVKRKRLIFIDETGAKTNMTRLYGRAQKGSRCHDSVPGRSWKRTTILSAIRDNGETYSHVFEGTLNSKIFEMYIEKILFISALITLSMISCSFF